MKDVAEINLVIERRYIFNGYLIKPYMDDKFCLEMFETRKKLNLILAVVRDTICNKVKQ